MTAPESTTGTGAGGERTYSRPRPPAVRFAPAKLNLTLAVIRRLENGYHSLHSVMGPLDLTDALTVTLARPRVRRDAEEGRDTLRTSGFDAGADADNLVLRAFDAARSAVRKTWPGAPAEPPGLDARLVKRIPVAAGLGGGSSDAASAIDAALELWDARLDAERAASAGASIGSDVPFFFAGGAALVTGRGEVVEPLRGVVGEPPGVLLVTPRVPVSTRAAYLALDAGVRPAVAGAGRLASEHFAGEMQRGLTVAQLLDRAAVLASANDLIAAAASVAPPILPFRRGLAKLLGRPVGQSGSGPTAWVLYPTKAEANAAARLVRTAIRDGRLPPAGTEEPLVMATTFLTGSSQAGGAASATAADATVPGDGSES